MQASGVLSNKALTNVARWYRTVLSHPHVAEYSGPITPTPAAPSSSSTSAPHAATNGISHGQATRGSEASTSQSAATSTSQSTPQLADHADGQQQKHERPKGKDANGQQQGQAKPKGKDAKGGKLAKNDVAKGQKKGGDKKEKPSQAPKGYVTTPVCAYCMHPPPPNAAAMPAAFALLILKHLADDHVKAQAPFNGHRIWPM